MDKITDTDIEWWEEHLATQYRHTYSVNVIPFVEQLVKLAKAVKEMQDSKEGNS